MQYIVANVKMSQWRWFGSLFVLSILLLEKLPGEVKAGGNLEVVHAINAGGYEHIDSYGIHYKKDPLEIGTASDYGNHLPEILRVPKEDEVLYRTERYHTATFGYDLPITGDDKYALILKFCEVYFKANNMKVFDVILNGRHEIVSKLDIFNKVTKGVAHDEYIFFTVSNGRLYYKEEESKIINGRVRLEFVKGRLDNPKINAFALLKGNVERIPRLPSFSKDMLPMDDDEDSVLLPVNEDVEPKSTPTPTSSKKRRTSGPPQPNPYSMDDSSMMWPVFIAIGAFIPLLFCLCKL